MVLNTVNISIVDKLPEKMSEIKQLYSKDIEIEKQPMHLCNFKLIKFSTILEIVQKCN